uniref:Secreted protein n=1 Tax=Anopheles stephensi TaxID=30069 RepID=A0A182YIN7_ANOST
MVISICVVLLTAYLGFTGCTATLDQDERNEVLQQNKSSSNKTERQKKPTQTTNDSDRSEDSSEDSKNVSEQEQESEDEATRQLHIESLGQLKSAKLKSIEKSLTDEQRQAEKEYDD